MTSKKPPPYQSPMDFLLFFSNRLSRFFVHVSRPPLPARDTLRHVRSNRPRISFPRLISFTTLYSDSLNCSWFTYTHKYNVQFLKPWKRLPFSFGYCDIYWPLNFTMESSLTNIWHWRTYPMIYSDPTKPEFLVMVLGLFNYYGDKRLLAKTHDRLLRYPYRLHFSSRSEELDKKSSIPCTT